MSIHSIEDFKNYNNKNWWILLNSDLSLKISVLSGKKLSNILGKNIPICHLSKLEILWVKDLLKASAKLEIWHTSKLGHAQKNSINSKKWDLKYTNICINIFLSHNILHGKFEAKIKKE